MFRNPMSNTPAALVAAIAAAVAGLLFLAAPRAAAADPVDKSVHWHASAATDAQGAPLPVAVSYEVWLEKDGQPDVLAASVADTACVLRLETGATYRVRVRGVSAGGLRSSFSEFSDPYRAPRPSPATLLAATGFTSVGPNPFNDTAVIACRLPSPLPGAGTVTLDIHDARGRRIRRWILEPGTGRLVVTWDGRDDQGRHAAAGAYLLRLACGAASWTRKLTMLP